MSVNSTDPLIGRLIDGRYQVRSRIARGGMATVYLATDLRLERRVALKVMHGHLADDSQYRARFIQEARSAARLAHPNVVNVYDQGQDGETAYLVMEYLPGITLRDLLQEHKILTSVQATDILEALLSGLAAAHKNGIVHRDLKPENVLLADDGRIKIGDFGLARAASANTATGNALLGTIAYLSPELVTRGVADARSDMYAVGIMLYEMLAGEQPFRGEQAFQIAYQHATETVRAPSIKNPRVPPELDELVLWATARDPDQRPHDATAMLSQLHEYEGSLRGYENDATGANRTIAMPTALGAAGFSIPAGPSRFGSTAETQAYSPPARHRTGPILTSALDSLNTKSARRRRTGWWLFALVITLAAVGVATGWYLGPGPGGQISLPQLTGRTPAAATATLVDLGLTVSPNLGQAYSPTITAGTVVDTKPAAGKTVARSSTITLLVSLGPKQLDYTTVVGMDSDAAIATIKSMGFRYDKAKSTTQFDASKPEGVVLAAHGVNNVDLATVKQYGDSQPISLSVSAGPVPNVTGKTFTEATAIFKAKGLIAEQGEDAYSDTIASGLVISSVPSKDASGNPVIVRPGSTVQLTLSKGPEQVQVPAVIGMTWKQAKAALLAAKFTLDYNKLADALPSTFIVSKTMPGANATANKGATVQVNFSGNF